MELDSRVAVELNKAHDDLVSTGQLLTSDQLNEYYNTFRSKFSPEVLKGLDGEALLTLMHDSSNRNSLVYWLEFKNDDEFPNRFGSILGGSALKFGIYRRFETKAWTGGSPTKQRELSLEEAVRIARNHRDQLAAGAELLTQLSDDAADTNYAKLQASMNHVAPDVGDSAWGHKYFSLLFPNKLDDYHSERWQRFHLTALLQVPPVGEGRYICAGRFVALARLLSIPINHLSTSLNHRTPGRDYWRVGTGTSDTQRKRWPLMRDGDFIAVGWSKIGNLSEIINGEDAREKIKGLINEHYTSEPASEGRAAAQILKFAIGIKRGDLVAACDGATVLGVGRVVGDYEYIGSSEVGHRRLVEWLNLDEWKMAEPEGPRTAVHQLGKVPETLIEIEKRILGAQPIKHQSRGNLTDRPVTTYQLAGFAGRIQSILERKGQVILYGPPGTGKTFWAQRVAQDLASIKTFGKEFASLDEHQQLSVMGQSGGAPCLVRTCCFHPSYGYEDFMEGYRPEVISDKMVFARKDGVFKRLCEEAANQPQNNFYLVIDEINRGDIPRIFGELLFALELDKRGKDMILPLSGNSMRVPQNVYVIGTMNTADRSIALLDTALRRRFGFVELMPDYSILEGRVVAGIPLALWLKSLNRRIRDHVGRDARNLQVGHAYLFEGGKPVSLLSRFVRMVREDIIPLVQEYCYEDVAALTAILGNGLVDSTNLLIGQILFDESDEDGIVQALLSPCSEITTSLQAIDRSNPEPNMVDNEDLDDAEVAS